MAGLKEGLCVGIGFETDNLMAVAASSEIALLNAEQSFLKVKGGYLKLKTAFLR